MEPIISVKDVVKEYVMGEVKIRAADGVSFYEYQQFQEDMPGFTQDTLDNAYIALEQARESEEAAFKKLYDALNSSYTVYGQALSLGYSSQKAVDARTQELKTLQTTLADDRNTLFVNYLSDIDTKNGYSAGN